ncbi:MAG: hypothetical protein JW784_06820 [Candidatus Cloacimonetes bacterium]|nr:hypothetical protein [Candidatus Cloacimonadota bacterium]
MLKIRENNRLLLSLGIISIVFISIFLINPDASQINAIRNISPLYLPLLVLLLIVIDSFWDMIKEKGEGGIINTLLISILLLVLTLQPIAQIFETIKIMRCDSCDLDKIPTSKQLEWQQTDSCIDSFKGLFNTR